MVACQEMRFQQVGVKHRAWTLWEKQNYYVNTRVHEDRFYLMFRFKNIEEEVQDIGMFEIDCKTLFEKGFVSRRKDDSCYMVRINHIGQLRFEIGIENHPGISLDGFAK